MRWIYISPHLDDAVLSAGGLIYEQTRAGMDVEIWNFMCGFPPSEELSPYAQILHSYAFDPPHEEEADLPAQIAKAISARLKPTDQLVCQFGLGSHVDHILVRRAVDLLQLPVLYDVDIPYLFKSPEELATNTAGMKEHTHRITEAGLKSWQDAISAYESQISSLFDSSDAMREQIKSYWAENSGLRLWSND